MKNIILLQTSLKPWEVEQINREFPQYQTLVLQDPTDTALNFETWSHVEILYGSRLTASQLSHAPLLRWIHSPALSIKRLCTDEIAAQGNILLTTASEENSAQVGEFAIGAILAFAKQFFNWQAAMRFPKVLWDSRWRNMMWSLQKRILVQIGLGKAGTEIARRAQQLDMQIWGVQPQKTFHPYCHKTFSQAELRTILPSADVVCVCLPRREPQQDLLKREELELMKEDSVLIVIGAHDSVNADDLSITAASGKFRGILFDAFHRPPIPLASPLWQIPGILITPDISARPKSTARKAFQIFHYNFRQYLHGNFDNMRYRIELDKNLSQ